MIVMYIIGERWPKLKASRRSQACVNPIRALMEKHFLPAMEQSDKDIYRLGIGQLLYDRPLSLASFLFLVTDCPHTFTQAT